MKLKCIKDFYLNGGKKAFAKDKMYEVDKKSAEWRIQENDLGHMHYLDDALIDKHFIKIEEFKIYKGWEILQMTDEDRVQIGQIIICTKDNKEYKVSKNGHGQKGLFGQDGLIDGLHLSFRDFIIKEKEYMTFLEAKKLGIPHHKVFGYRYGDGVSAEDFVKEMDKKVWEVQN